MASLFLVSTRRLKAIKVIKSNEMNRSEKALKDDWKQLKVVKNDELYFYTHSQTFLNDFTCTFKEIFRLFEIFRIPLKIVSNYDELQLRRFSGHFSKSSKYVPTEQHWTCISTFKILCSCGLGKLCFYQVVKLFHFLWEDFIFN